MATPPETERGRTPGNRPRRSYSIWSVMAPIGALVLFIAVFQAAGNSCLLKECADNRDDAAETAGPANDLKSGAKAKVKAGDTLGSLAERFKLSQEELVACNPDVDAQTLQPNTWLNVSAVDCEGQDKAAAGANPDPLAGETSATPNPTSKNAPENNGTAAADPSATGAAGAADAPADETAAEAGDEG
jgi:LysM repeat protein